MRTTLDIDKPVLEELKRRGRTEGKSVGRVVSEMLAAALHADHMRKAVAPRFTWVVKPMGAKVDLADHDALLDAMDKPVGR